MAFSQKELFKALTQRFIQLTLDDGTVHAGYIGNPNDFDGETMPPQIVLLNGLMQDTVDTARVVDVQFPRREDTTSIPIIDTPIK